MANETNTSLATLQVSAVPDVLALLQEKLKGLKQISETQYKTGSSGMVTNFPKAIQDETSVETLIKMHSSIYGRAKAYDASMARLSEIAGGAIIAPVFKDNGASLENIEEDIALRIRVLNISGEKAELEGLIKEAEGFMTKEDQFAVYKAKIAAKLGKTS